MPDIRTSTPACVGTAQRWRLAALTSVIGLLGLGCETITEDESAITLSITAADTTLVAEAIRVDVSDVDSGQTKSETYSDLGGWPVDPSEHTVLLVASTPDDTERAADVLVTACDTVVSCISLAEASLTVTFPPGEVSEESVTLY